MKKFLMILMALALPVMGQGLRWKIDAQEILPGAKSSLLSVQVNASDTAFILLQTDTKAKLVRTGGTGGNTQVFDLPDTVAGVPYSFRLTEENKAMVQAGRRVTQVVLRDTRVSGKKVKAWVKRDVVLPVDEDEVGLTIVYDAEAQRMGQHVWYATTNGDAVQQVIMRDAP